MASSSTGMPFPVVRCAGVPITTCSPEEAANEVVRLATCRLEKGLDIHLCNAYTVALADKRPEFRSMLEQASVNFPDGKAVVWANQLLNRGTGVPSERVYGPDLFLDVFDLGQELDLRHYLLGGTPTVLETLEAEVRRRFPTANIVGSESPPFRELSGPERDEQVGRLTKSGAQLVWLGLGTPKQDWEASRLAQRVPAAFCAVGAAFDFVAGAKSQAPMWMQKSGLEWLYRLASEPGRLWKRYLFGNARFIAAVFRCR